MNKTLLFFSAKTNGTINYPAPSDDPSQPHLVQLSAHVVEVPTRKIIHTMDVIIKPDGWDIAPEESDVHGITAYYANEYGIPEYLALEFFLRLWNKYPRVAFGTTINNRIIRIATKRYVSTDIADAWKEGSKDVQWICAMLAAKKIMGGKNPSLAEAYGHFTGKEMQSANTGIGDVNALMELYWEMMYQKSATEAAAS